MITGSDLKSQVKSCDEQVQTCQSNAVKVSNKGRVGIFATRAVNCCPSSHNTEHIEPQTLVRRPRYQR